MWELDHKEDWALKNWCFWTVVLKKTPESSLDCKQIRPVNPKGNQLWIFTGRTDAEAEAPILWPPDAKGWLAGKDPVAGKNWKLKEKGTTENEMVGWHYRLSGYEFEPTPGDGEGQGSLACCSPWGLEEWDMTERLNNKLREKDYYYFVHCFLSVLYLYCSSFLLLLYSFAFHWLMFCRDTIWLLFQFLLCIFYRHFLCSYHVACIKYLTFITIYFKLIIIQLQVYIFYILTSPPDFVINVMNFIFL